MQNQDIFSKIDHTVLKAFTTWEDVEKLCDEAVKHKMASVCVPPCYVKKIKDKYNDELKICTVIGFPLGYNVTEVKELETVCALRDGADEIDMVINICEVKNGNFGYVEDEIARLRKLTEGKILKVIVETCYLTEEEKKRLCEIVSKVKVDFIKTSTGFGSGGATIEDIRLFKENIGDDVKMKASGGIKTKEDMILYLNEGCQRLGTSSATVLTN
jgi:deoxyribose-phosphate aldolase